VKNLILNILVFIPFVCGASEMVTWTTKQTVILTAEQSKALSVAYADFNNQSESYSYEVMISEDVDFVTISFPKDTFVNELSPSIRGGGGKTLAYQISKKNFQIVSKKVYLTK
jgi:hypothetical protein